VADRVIWGGELHIEELRLSGCGVLLLDNNLHQRTLEKTDTVVQDSKGKTHRFSNEGSMSWALKVARGILRLLKVTSDGNISFRTGTSR
jgi:hypothetical protein